MGLFDWLFGKKVSTAAKSVSDAEPAASWRVGDRVLASWLDAFFYPGRVRNVQGSNCEIAFDDGDSAWIHEANVRRPDIQVGSLVFCRHHAGPMYLPAIVREQRGEKLQVEYESGEKEWTTISMVRVQRPMANTPAQPSVASMLPPGMMAMQGGMPMQGPGMPMMGQGPMPPQQRAFIPDLGDPVSDSNWRIGDRVLGRWFDLFWYPGTILAMGTKGYHILFDDGDQRVVQDLGLMTLDVDEGEHIFVRPKNQPQRIYAPATVTHAHGETIDVEFEDGAAETNLKVSRARFWRCPVGVKSFNFDEGERVWAQDIDGYTYPAEILSIDGDKIIVHFLDGPERMLTPELIRRFDLNVGLTMECRWRGGGQYFPGRISQVEGDRIFVDYADGDKEWNTVRLVRLPPREPQETRMRASE
jgi:hypothetical protein